MLLKSFKRKTSVIALAGFYDLLKKSDSVMIAFNDGTGFVDKAGSLHYKAGS